MSNSNSQPQLMQIKNATRNVHATDKIATFENLCCLLVEDSFSDAAIFQTDIKRSNLRNQIQILHAENIEGARQKLSENSVDVIVLDYNLPDSDGLATIRLFQKEHSKIPIIILTGQEDDELGLALVNSGAQDYIVKGILPSEAIARVIRYSILRKRVENSLLSAELESENRAEFFRSFLAQMSHEIRSPLSSLLGILELFSQNKFSEENKEKYLCIAQKTGRLLLSIVNDILDASAMQKGVVNLEYSSFSLLQLIDDTLSILDLNAKAKSIVLKKVLIGPIPAIFCGDSRRIQQILINLVSNAIKFTNQGEVCLRITGSLEKPDQVKFEIQDTGIGMSPEQVEKLFNQFEQTSQHIHREFGGTGLGLYISRHLTRLMGSDIVVRSEPGKGTEFEFTLSSFLK